MDGTQPSQYPFEPLIALWSCPDRSRCEIHRFRPPRGGPKDGQPAALGQEPGRSQAGSLQAATSTGDRSITPAERRGQDSQNATARAIQRDSKVGPDLSQPFLPLASKLKLRERSHIHIPHYLRAIDRGARNPQANVTQLSLKHCGSLRIVKANLRTCNGKNRIQGWFPERGLCWRSDSCFGAPEP